MIHVFTFIICSVFWSFNIINIFILRVTSLLLILFYIISSFSNAFFFNFNAIIYLINIQHRNINFSSSYFIIFFVWFLAIFYIWFFFTVIILFSFIFIIIIFWFIFNIHFFISIRFSFKDITSDDIVII